MTGQRFSRNLGLEFETFGGQLRLYNWASKGWRAWSDLNRRWFAYGQTRIFQVRSLHRSGSHALNSVVT